MAGLDDFIGPLRKVPKARRRRAEEARTDAGPYDPDVDERRALVRAAEATGALSPERAAALAK